MLVAIAIVTSMAWWDERREANAALDDLETEQTVVASSLAASLRAHLGVVERDAVLLGDPRTAGRVTRYMPAVVRDSMTPRTRAEDPSRLLLTVALEDGRRVDLGVSPGELLDREHRIERKPELNVFLSAPDEAALRAVDGRILSSPRLRDALDRGARTQRLGRPEAAQVGLPERTAMAGLARVDAGRLGRWGVAVVASAGRERDRETRALWRLVLSVLLACGLVLGFGGTALRKQRKQLELARELGIAEVQRFADQELARAQRVATMGTFAMGVAHEVATPLGVIVGRAEQLLMRVHGDDRTAHAAKAILEQGDRIQHIVRRFLDMARGGPPSLERTDPATIARAAATSIEHRFAKANVSLKMDIPASMPPVQCDRALLEQAIVNLLLNACEACGSGGHVEVAARPDAERVAFVVTNDGTAIRPEHARRATEPFFTTKPAGAGTGLGLAIATEIAKSHRGDLTIASDGDHCTRARIEIPVAPEGR